ncbi:phosphoserine phosphatase, partial [Bacillus subtilis]|nr:phosphoserine phosphatase [Bacillus subtilis]
PDIRSHLKKGQSVEEISNSLKMYTTSRKDDLTYILGQLS